MTGWTNKRPKWVRQMCGAWGVFSVGAVVSVVPFSVALICQSWAPQWLLALFDGPANDQYGCQCRTEWMWFIFCTSLLVAFYLAVERLRIGELPRMRHAIAGLLLIGLAVASATIFAWNWLGSGG